MSRIVLMALLHNLDSNNSLTAACVAAFAPPTIHSLNTHNAKYIREAVHPKNSVYRSNAAFLLLVWGIFCKSVRSMKNGCGGCQPSLGFCVVTFSMKHPCASPRFTCSVIGSIVCWWSVLVSYICICACVSYLYRYSICVCVRYLYCSCFGSSSISPNR